MSRSVAPESGRPPRTSGRGRRLLLWLALPPLGLVLLLAALVGLSHIVPLNFLRPLAEAQLGAALSRPVSLSGDLWIRVGPSVRFVAKGLEVRNPQDSHFPQDIFLSAQRVSIDIPVLTLLSGNPQITRASAAGGNLVFQVRADGVNNWNLSETTDTSTERSIALPDTLRIQDGRVALIDIPANQESVIEHLQVDLTPLPADTGDAGGGGAAGQPQLLPGWDLKADGQISGEPVALTSRRSPEVRAGVHDLQFDLQSDFATAAAKGRVFDAPLPGFDGTVQADIPSVGRLAHWLQIPLDPGKPDPGALALTATLSADGSRSVLDRAELTGPHAQGVAQGSLRDTGAGLQLAGMADFGLLDVDAYLPPPDVETELPTPIANLAILQAIRQIAQLPDSPVPLDWLDGMAGNYGLRVDRLVLRDVELEQSVACLDMAKGSARLTLFEDNRGHKEESGEGEPDPPEDGAGICAAMGVPGDEGPDEGLQDAQSGLAPAKGEARTGAGEAGARPSVAVPDLPAGTGRLVLTLRKAPAGSGMAAATDDAATPDAGPAGGQGPLAAVTLEAAASALPIGRMSNLFPAAPPSGKAAPAKQGSGKEGSGEEGTDEAASGQLAHLTGTASLHTRGATWLRLAAHLEGALQAGLSAQVEPDGRPAASITAAAPKTGEPLTARLEVQIAGETLGIDLKASPLQQILLGDEFSLNGTLTGKLGSGTIDGVIETRPVPAFRGKADLQSEHPGPLLALALGDSGLKDYQPGKLSLSLSLVEKGEAVEIETAKLDLGQSHFEASGRILPQNPVKATLSLTGTNLDMVRLLPPTAQSGRDSGGALPKRPVSALFPEGLELDLTANLSDITGEGIALAAMDLQGRVAPQLLSLKGSGTPAGGGSLSLDLSLDGSATPAQATGSLDLKAEDLGRLFREAKGAAAGGTGSLAVTFAASGDSLAALATGVTGQADLTLTKMRGPSLHPVDKLTAQLQARADQTQLDAKAEFPKPEVGADDAISIAAARTGQPAVTRNPLQARLVCQGTLWHCLVAGEVPATLTLQSGDSRLELNGTAALHHSPARVSGKLDFSGKRLSDWDAAVADALPLYGPYSLTADVILTPMRQEFRGLALQIAKSDFAGRLALDWQDGRMVMDADLKSNLLRTADFGSDNVDGQKFAEKVRVPTDWLAWLRGKAQLAVSELVVQSDLTMHDVTTALNSDGKRLSVERFQADVMKGRLDLQGSLQGASGAQAAVGVKGSLQDGDMAVLLERLGQPGIIDGALDAVVDLQSRGATLDALVHQPSGTFFVQVDKGQISNQVLGILSVKIADLFSPLFGKDTNTRLQCLQGHGSAQAGVVQVPSLLLDTSIFSVTGNGQVNLPKAQMDLDFRVMGERISVSSLAPAFSVSGPFADPQVSINMGKTALDLAPSLLSSLAGEVASIVKGVTGTADRDNLRPCPVPGGVPGGGAQAPAGAGKGN